MENRKKDKKEAILDATLTLITKYGLHAVSMKMIAAEANVAAGTIYVYFKNKEEMLTSLYLILAKKINGVMESVYKEDSSVKENFINIWSHILMEYIKDQRIPEFITQYSFSTITSTSNRVQLLSPIFEFLESARRDNIVKNIPLPGLIALAHGPITSLTRMFKNTDFEMSNIDVEIYAGACWDCIKK